MINHDQRVSKFVIYIQTYNTTPLRVMFPVSNGYFYEETRQ